jgi:hypothetical protein
MQSGVPQVRFGEVQRCPLLPIGVMRENRLVHPPQVFGPPQKKHKPVHQHQVSGEFASESQSLLSASRERVARHKQEAADRSGDPENRVLLKVEADSRRQRNSYQFCPCT